MDQVTRPTRNAIAGVISALVLASCSDSSDPSTPANVSSVTFAASSLTISQGETRVLGLTVKDASGNVVATPIGVEWSSSNTTILDVNQSGEVQGKALGGPVTVSATAGGITATATANVVPARVAFSPIDSNIVLGTTLQLSGTMVDYAGAPIAGGGTVTWGSSDPAVATVGGSTGLLTTVGSGETRISATAAGRTSTRTFRVGVVSPYDGRWSGVSDGANPSQGRTLTASFHVIFGRVYLFELKWTHAFVLANGNQFSCPFVLTATAPGAPTIVNDAFTTTAAATGVTPGTVTGTFTTPATLAGTHTAMNFGSAPNPLCAMVGGTIFIPSTGVGASTWTATKAP